MSQEMVLSIGRDALVTALLVAGPVLGLGFAVGLLISIFQATTQINEQTLTYVPKIVAVLAAVLLFGPWMLNTIVDYSRRVFELLPQVVR